MLDIYFLLSTVDRQRYSTVLTCLPRAGLWIWFFARLKIMQLQQTYCRFTLKRWTLNVKLIIYQAFSWSEFQLTRSTQFLSLTRFIWNQTNLIVLKIIFLGSILFIGSNLNLLQQYTPKLQSGISQLLHKDLQIYHSMLPLHRNFFLRIAPASPEIKC